ncbi:hypothetical protein NEF87_002034 [Candidatus Lokiarchaeum ossiferum]|uniref:Uncharacterized protein n=1 Tax=Candidatus Lokiarchaeum ossiferum TaxID=2951803 RepID=A0ABY6HTH4_9ARCH|nr:hypothetical protein NEF87_002034 [Candidatus Lokiarchaeum sp. B-35]
MVNELIFERFKSNNLTDSQCQLVQKILKHYILGIFISRSGGDILYDFQLDESIKIDLISHFIAALSMFGEENVGKIKRIFIEGLDIEMSIVQKHDLVSVTFFRPNMVKDYLEAESSKGLDLFYNMFEESIKAGKNNKAIYEGFDDPMCHLIQEYLQRLGILKDKEK